MDSVTLIEAHKHSYLDLGLCKFIERHFLLAQWVKFVQSIIARLIAYSTSGENIAEIFNSCISQPGDIPPLTSEVVWDAFFLHSLLRDAQRRNYGLALPHHGRIETRFDQALHERNVIMAGTGQPNWAHACDDCMKIKIDSTGKRCMSARDASC